MRSLIEKKFIRNYSIGLAVILVFLGMISAPTPASDDKKSDSSNEVPVHMIVTVKPRHSGGQVPAVGPADVKVYQRDKQNAVTSWVPLQ
jgi:hypothetical protein